MLNPDGSVETTVGRKLFMSFSSRLFSFAAIAALAGAGLMQGAQQGTFHLSTAAYWGQALLQPGDYRILLPDPSLEQVQLRIVGPERTVFALPLTTYYEDNESSSYLKLSQIDGNYFIREFTSGYSGKKFTFSVPKRSRHLDTTKSTDNSVNIAVN
jgi:hypothetical protein